MGANVGELICGAGVVGDEGEVYGEEGEVGGC